MRLSQFTLYSYSDFGAPVLNGLSGSLIDVLDGCLVNGYGNKTPIGWLKPIPNDPTNDLACYQQPSGSGMTLFVNDASPYSSSTALTRDAWVCGYERIIGLTQSFVPSPTNAYNNGEGIGAFPFTDHSGVANMPGSGETGSVIWRKSTTLDAKPRYWYLFGDAHTFYLFVQSGNDAVQSYHFYAFGDIFSFKKTPDLYKCILIGRLQSSTADSMTIEPSDYVVIPGYTTYPHFMARGWGGGGRCVPVHKAGNIGLLFYSTTQYYPTLGYMSLPNPADGIYYMSPYLITDITNGFRGRMRGLYFSGASTSHISDGQLIKGVGETSGKEFQVIEPGKNSGNWLVEISPTVETNDLP